jgi:hypothetical protein
MAIIGHVAKQINRPTGAIGHGGRFFAARLAAAHGIERDIGDDTVEPGVKGALEAEVRKIPVGLEEGFLHDVLRIILRSGDVEGQAQDSLVMLPDQRIEGAARARLRLADQLVFQRPLGTGIAWRNGFATTESGTKRVGEYSQNACRHPVSPSAELRYSFLCCRRAARQMVSI